MSILTKNYLKKILFISFFMLFSSFSYSQNNDEIFIGNKNAIVEIKIEVIYEIFPLEKANEALQKLKDSKIDARASPLPITQRATNENIMSQPTSVFSVDISRPPQPPQQPQHVQSLPILQETPVINIIPTKRIIKRTSTLKKK